MPPEEERPRHAGMGYSETDTALASVDKILLIQRIDDIESYQQFLIMPGQRNDMIDRKIIDRVRRTMSRIGLSAFFRRPQSRRKQHLPRDGRSLEQLVAQDPRRRQRLLVIAMDAA